MPRWTKRRSHIRRLPNGRTTSVRECAVFMPDGEGRAAASYRHTCPQCGADLVSIRMPNGGWVHFEGQRGLGRVKHPCLHIGEGLSNRRDEQTPDLFEDGPF